MALTKERLLVRLESAESRVASVERRNAELGNSHGWAERLEAEKDDAEVIRLALANLETQEWLAARSIPAPHDPDFTRGDDYCLQAMAKLRGEKSE